MKIDLISITYKDMLLLFLLKSNLESRLNQLFSEPHASFAAGLLLGSRRGIPPDLMDAFNQSGLTHIIAISGYNITLIIACMLSLLRGLSRRVQIVISSATIFIFVILVGATSAVIRASVMGVIALWALGLGRALACGYGNGPMESFYSC